MALDVNDLNLEKAVQSSRIFASDYRASVLHGTGSVENKQRATSVHYARLP